MKPENVKCPLCDGPMKSRKSVYGVFWGCAAYPQCKGTRNVMGEAPRSVTDVTDESAERNNLAPSEQQRKNDQRRWNN
jgi:ssDNA-binding Zn-finger/Zn-ribbon topoisomerase 1